MNKLPYDYEQVWPDCLVCETQHPIGGQCRLPKPRRPRLPWSVRYIAWTGRANAWLRRRRDEWAEWLRFGALLFVTAWCIIIWLLKGAK